MPEAEIPKVLNSIFTNSGSQLFYLIENADRKVWMIPDINCSVALQIYQPSNLNGKLLKSCFPVIKRFAFVRYALGISVHKYGIQPFLLDFLCKLYKVKNVEITLFCGTPSVHQKITMQVTNGSKILGYCKISEKEEVKALFQHKESILKTLYDKGITNIPQCLYNGLLQDETHIFVQTSTKTKNSKVLHQLSVTHWDFLSQLHQKTKTSLPFEKSDFYQSLQLLKENMSCCPSLNISCVRLAITRAEEFYKGKQVEFSFYHSDFTPWNMFVEKDELFVFDWEYAKHTFPPFMDAFHFFTQVYIFVQHKNAEGIMATYRANRRIFSKYVDNPDFSYKCYLLSIISFYLDRDKGQVRDRIGNSLDIWLHLTNALALK
jgi:hypothetical protein